MLGVLSGRNRVLRSTFPCEIGFPELLDRVVIPDFGTKQVNNHITGIDQHPFTTASPLGVRAANTGFLEIFEKMFGYRVQPTRGCAAGHNHVISDIGFSRQGNHPDIIGLVVVERFLDKRQGLRRCWPRRGLALTCYDENCASKLRLLVTGPVIWTPG